MVVTVLLVLVISGHLGAGHTQQTLQTDGRPRHNLPPVAPGIHKDILISFTLAQQFTHILKTLKNFCFIQFSHCYRKCQEEEEVS